MNKPFWYKKPDFLSSKSWKKWYEDTKVNHPIQYFLRETMGDWWHRFNRSRKDLYYTIRSWFRPEHSMVRNSIPRRWSDLTELIHIINFAIILDFKGEADDSYVDWESDDEHIQFKKWLDNSAKYIEKERPALEIQLNDAYPEVDIFGYNDPTPFDVKYAEVIRLENLIKDTDTKILKEMIDFRDYFWT